MWLGAGIPCLCALLGTGETGWEQGIAAFLIGAAALAAPPTTRIPLPLLVTLGGFFGITLLAMLPIPWPFRPDWWLSLSRDFDVVLPISWSPQPWITLETWCRFALFAIWMLWWMCRAPGYGDLRLATRIIATGLAALALVTFGFRALGWEPPWWNYAAAPQFGPLANRNVFAAIMSMGAIAALACSYDLQRRRNGSWALYALSIVPMFAAVLANRSRAGLLLFLLTVLLWFSTISLRRGMMQTMAIGGSIMLAATAALVIFGQQILERLAGEKESIVNLIADEGRLTLFSDTLRLAVSSPGLGFGLGNFSDWFGLANELHETKDRFRHPESDWLWFLAESGFFAIAFLILAAGMLALWSIPVGSGSDDASRNERRLHSCAAIGVFIALLHATVNPALHALPYFLYFAAFCGMAVFPSRWARSKSVAPTTFFRLGGTFCLLAGAVWWASQLGLTVVFGQTAQQAQLALARQAVEKQNFQAALSSADNAVRAAPLNWESYFERAATRLAARRPAAEAASDFAVARYLEPSISSLPFAEGNLWLQYSPANAISAWREAMRREQPHQQSFYFYNMLTQLKLYPELRADVRSLANTPQLMVQYLPYANDDDDMRAALETMLTLYPSLEQLSAVERRRVFAIWYAKGDRESLLKQIQQTPSWASDGWPIVASDLADKGDPQSAVTLAMKTLRPPLKLAGESTTNQAQLLREFSLFPNDPRRGLSLFHSQITLNQTQDALATLLRVKAMPGAPRYLDYEFARVHAKLGDFARAWDSVKAYLNVNPDY